jgi:tight adherence protein C
MSNSVDLLAWGGIGLIGLALAFGSFTLLQHPPTKSPYLGLRGLKRQNALAKGGLFATFEPPIRFVAGLVSRLPLGRLRQRIERQLIHAGDLLGLTPDEYIALSTLSALGFLMIALALRDVIGTSPSVLIFVMASGAMLVHLRVVGEIQRRQRHVDRSLPVMIDLVALCMGAGLDFPGALRQVLDKALAPGEPTHEEMTRILQVLDLGRTRRDALTSFAERVPTEAVKEFVSSVVQAEEKGNPLSEVLRIQARMLRMRRSVEAEQNASRAGVMMMLPLLLIFASIIILLLGPFIISGMKSGF